jgi:proteasome lid subunit RPN8/RPN11
MPFRLRMPRKLYNRMIAQARAELPNECCGLLAGRVVTEHGTLTDTPVGQVLACYPLANMAASPVEYLSDARGMFDAVREMRSNGIDILAVYHSHPTSGPVPSRKDLERNYSETVVNLIISLRGPEPAVRGWWLTASDFREAEWDCVDDES